MFARKPLRDDVGAEVLSRIIDGRLPSGARINESHLSAEMDISRTPLREALLCLVTEGVVVSDMGRGFAVPHLQGREVVDLLDTLAVLAPACVRGGAAVEMTDIMNARNNLGRARMVIDGARDMAEYFYVILETYFAECPNRILRDQCRTLTRRTLRYIHEAHIRGWSARAFLDDMAKCIDKLDRGDRLGAAESLDQALRDLGGDLAQRFPAEVSGRA